MQDDKENYFNKGVPIKLPNAMPVNIKTLLDLAKNRKSVENNIIEMYSNNIHYIETLLASRSLRKLIFGTNFLLVYNKDTKSNELVFNSAFIINIIVDYLNIKVENDNKGILTATLIYTKIKELSSITSEKKLKKKFPLLHDLYLKELKEYHKLNNHLKTDANGNIDLLKRTLVFKDLNSADKEIFIDDTLKMISVKSFCRIYGEMLKNIVDNYEKIKTFFMCHPIDMSGSSFDKAGLEAYVALKHIYMINHVDDVSDKQKYLYYLNAYFNENRKWINKDIEIKLLGKTFKFDELYDIYIDILIANPELKVVNYERDEFETFTSDEVETYMNLELSDAKANWTFLKNGLDDERVAKAIHNETKHMKDKEKKQRKKENLKNLYFSKKNFFDNTFNFRTVEGKNAFDGYIAFIYPNGTVVLEKFFEKRKDKSEVIARDNAIYVMNIEEFYSLTNLSKTAIIRDKLCKRYIHRGNWQDRVLAEINNTGTSPNSEYKKLVKSGKIEDIDM